MASIAFGLSRPIWVRPSCSYTDTRQGFLGSVQNVITRVTGGQPSALQGRIVGLEYSLSALADAFALSVQGARR